MSLRAVFTSGLFVVSLGVNSFANAGQSVEIGYLDLKQSCIQDGFVLPGSASCNLISQDGRLLSEGDDHYRLIVSEIEGLDESEGEGWDDLTLMFNQSYLPIGPGGDPEHTWMSMIVVTGSNPQSPLALIFKRSLGVDDSGKPIQPHYFLIGLGQESSCLIPAHQGSRYQKTQAFRNFSDAFALAKTLEHRHSMEGLCGDTAQPKF